MTTDSLQARAESHLRLIRESMDRARGFTAIPGWGGLGMGILGTIVAVTAATAASPRGWLQQWLACAAVAGPLGLVSLLRKAGRAGTELRSGVGLHFVGGLAPPILAGAVLTWVLAQARVYQALPATWLLLYGTATVVGGLLSVPPVRWMGLGFMLLGLVAAFFPLAVGNLLLGLGFGLLQAICGVVIVRRYGG